ncbi:MAG: hypothetical protein ACW981_11635 [Candidatus Hodarchaeales archaeon]|jgi:chromosome segregation ATPase
MVISDLQKANKIISSALENLTLQLANVTKKVDALEVELESNRNIIKEKDLEVKYLKEQLSGYKSEDKSVIPLTQELIEPYFTQMKNSLENNKESIFTKQAEILDPFQSQMKELENKLSSISNNVNNLQSKIDTSPDRSREVDEFEAKYHDLKMVSTELAEKIAKLEEERERNELTISNLQTQLDENENLIKTIQDEAATLIQEKNQIQEEFNTISDSESSEERLKLIRDEFKEVEENYLKETSELKSELEILRKFKDKTISTVETEEEKEEVSELKEKIVNLESENNSLHKQIQTFDRIIGDIKKAEEELDSETSLKEEEISYIRSEKEGLIEKVTELQLSLDSIENKIKQRDMEIYQLKNDLQRSNEDKTKLQNQLVNLKSESTEDNDLQESMIIAEKTLREAQDLLQTKNAENVALKEKITRFEETDSLIEKTQSDIKTQAEMIDKLQNQVATLETNLKLAQTEIEQKNAELEDAKTSSSRRRSSSRTLGESPVRLESITNLSPDELREKLKTFLQNIIDLEEDLDSAEDEIENLESEIIQLKESNESVSLEMDNKSNLLESRTNQLEYLAKEFEEVRKKLESEGKEEEPEIVNRLKSVIEDKDYKIRRLEEQQIHDQSTIAKLEANLERITEEKDQLKSIVENDQ